MSNDPKPKSRVGEVISKIRENRAQNLEAKSKKIEAKAKLVEARAEGKAKKIQARAEAKKVNRDYPLSATPEPRAINPPVMNFLTTGNR
jgi:regulator of protease activity HflC (stomatin/prohibitin superfamily)